jgi:hypothetical protein
MEFDLREIDAKASAAIRLRTQVGFEETKKFGQFAASNVHAGNSLANKLELNGLLLRSYQKVASAYFGHSACSCNGIQWRLNAGLASSQQLPGKS